MAQFNCDQEWWSELNDFEKKYWLDFAESCGAPRKPFFVGRNPNYPNMICMPSVSLGTFGVNDL